MRFYVLSWVFSISLAFGGDFYVSPQGLDSNAGKSVDTSWKTVAHAAKSVSAGDTVHVRAGVYTEAVDVKVSGTEGRPIIFQPYQDERPVLDGGKIEVKSKTAILHIEDVSHVVFRGFEIRNLKTAKANKTAVGIMVTGSAHHIELRDNYVHSIETNLNKRNGGDAHGIGVFGTKVEPLHHIVIDGNTLNKLKLGSSEALVLNGNVKDFQVTNNQVHDCDNIAIDFIGFEKVGPKPELDQARDGVCAGNTVYNIDSFGNPAYGKDRSAGGIYVDGGTDILITRNQVWNCNIGIELASEHKGRSTSKITLHNNLIYRNQIGGIFIGGYNKKRGLTEDCVIRNNTLFHNDTRHDGNGEFYLQFGTKNNKIENNLFIANDQNLLVANRFEENENNVLRNNLYFIEDEPKYAMFQWKKVRYKGWDTWKASGHEANGIFKSPGFVDPSKNDFHLAAGSPAIDSGTPGFQPDSGETDFEGRSRLVGQAVDIGALEVQ